MRPRWRPALRVFGTLAAVFAIVLVVNLIGGEALRRIGQHGRYRVAFAEVKCDPPRGLDRAAFLNEVRYLSGFPETFHPLDESDRTKLAAAFARHPWVEHVEDVIVEPGTIVRVKLTYRTPALAVPVEGGAVRLVDPQGILLPESLPPADVAELVNVVPVPAVSAGESWPDDLVIRSLDLMKSYPISKLERMATGWRLTRRDGTSLTIEK